MKNTANLIPSFSCLCIFLSSTEPAISADAPIDIGTRRELFVDDLLIGGLKDASLKMHEPQLLRGMPRRPFGHYATVLKDGERLRLYYRGDKVPGAHWRNGWGKYHEGEVTLYAESHDGRKNWIEPNLGIHKIPEMPKGNAVLQARAGAITDIVLMATRPGSDRYHRHFKEAFIRPGLGQRGWGNRANYITLNAVQTSPTHMSMFMYGGGHYVLRLDGFISIHAGYEKCEFITKPFKFAGHELELNYSTSGAGRLRVEVQDADGKPISGFSLEDCNEIYGDAIAGTVKWKDNADVSQLAGNVVRLRFVMNESDIYSIRFRPSDSAK